MVSKRGAYKTEIRKSTVGSAVESAYDEVESLAEEMRSNYDNMESNNLGSTSKCAASGEAADALEGLDRHDVPEYVIDLECSYSEQVNRRKGRGPSRATRAANAAGMLSAAMETVRAWIEEQDNDTDTSEAENFVDEVESQVGEIEGVEFPGMYG